MKPTILFLVFISIMFAYEEPFDPNDYRDREIRAVRITETMYLDGRLEEALYNGPAASDFIRYEPFNGSKASQIGRAHV